MEGNTLYSGVYGPLLRQGFKEISWDLCSHSVRWFRGHLPHNHGKMPPLSVGGQIKSIWGRNSLLPSSLPCHPPKGICHSLIPPLLQNCWHLPLLTVLQPPEQNSLSLEPYHVTSEGSGQQGAWWGNYSGMCVLFYVWPGPLQRKTRSVFQRPEQIHRGV